MIKKHIKIAVEITATDKDNKLIIEPAKGNIIILSDTSGLKIGVDRKELIDAIYDLDYMKKSLLPPEEETKPESFEVGEILEGDEEP